MIYKPQIFEFPNLDSLYQNLFLRLEKTIIENMGEYSHSRILFDGDPALVELYRKISQSLIVEWENIEIYQSSEEILNQFILNTRQKNIIEGFEDAVLEKIKNIYLFKKSENAEIARNLYEDVIDSLDGVFFDQTVITVNKSGSIGGVFDLNNKNIVNANKFNISLSPDTILNSRELSILIDPDDANETIKELIEGNSSVKDFPAKIIFSHPSVNIYFSI